MDSRAVATVSFIKGVDTLYESFNDRTYRAPGGKELRCTIKENSSYLKYLAEAIKKIDIWTYKSSTIKQTRHPSQNIWLTSLDAINGCRST